MAQAHRCFHFVHILSAGSARAHGFPCNIGRIYFNFNCIVDQRGNEYRGKRGLPFVLCIKWRKAYQAVHPVFTFEIPVSIVALNLYGAVFQPNVFSGQVFHHPEFVAICFGPAVVHAEKHFSPVVAFRATGTCIDT